MARHFRPYDLNQRYLLPPDMREWVPRDDLIWFISDVVDTLDVSAIYREYSGASPRTGLPAGNNGVLPLGYDNGY